MDEKCFYEYSAFGNFPNYGTARVLHFSASLILIVHYLILFPVTVWAGLFQS